MEKEYQFFGNDNCDVKPIHTNYKLKDPKEMYDYLSNIWCEYSCAPRMRKDWSKENMTLGQCSITSFLVQDIFGGEVYGVPLGDGTFHCYNVVNNIVFDLTSEQFIDKKIHYDLMHIQLRGRYFARLERYARYLMLKSRLLYKTRR